MQKRVKSQKKFAKLTAAVALSAAIVSTSIPLTGMEVKAEDTSAAQANVISVRMADSSSTTRIRGAFAVVSSINQNTSIKLGP